MELDKIGDRPTALFVITPPTTRAFNFLAALMYTQLFTLLQNKANLTYKDQGMTLPHKVWFIWMNLRRRKNSGSGYPDYPYQVRWYVCSIIVQAPSQLEAIYDKITPTIVSNCSILLFLGSSGHADHDSSAADFISKNLGQKTIQAENVSVSYHQGSKQLSYSYSPTQRPLMTSDEVKRLPAEDCLILIGGQKPIRAKKNMRLEQCLNYDLYKKIGNYDLDYKKATSVTYIEGREKSEAIQKQQDLERQAEYARRKEFKAINSKYAKDSGLQESKNRYCTSNH